MPYESEKSTNEKQEEILKYIKEYQETAGHAPSASEIVVETGIMPSVVKTCLDELEHKGFIEQNRFGIKLIASVKSDIPSNTNRKLKVFLCHASQDKPIVRELYQRLIARRLD